MKIREKQILAVSPIAVVYHFGTSGIAVATATGITHPLGFSLYMLTVFILNFIRTENDP